MKIQIMKKVFHVIALILLTLPTLAQDVKTSKSTEDLAYLIGEWDVKRTNNPDGDEPIVRYGTLTCKWDMDNQFIFCVYDIERPGKRRGLDYVYLNYNDIYDKYESTWLSSTWPIKSTMQGDFSMVDGQRVLSTTTEFPIANGVMEYVKGQTTITSKDSFHRKLHIRTSEKPEWYYHMIEEIERKK